MPERRCSIVGCERIHRARGWCSTHYNRWRLFGHTMAEEPVRDGSPRPPICSTPACEKPTDVGSGRLCSMHRRRLRTTGILGLVPHADGRRRYEPLISASGYRWTWDPHHPLVQGKRDNFAAEHRKVLYDKIGPGSHPCWQCGVLVEWGSTLTADHVDFDRLNNVPGNLMPACRPCNSTRHAPDILAREVP